MTGRAGVGRSVVGALRPGLNPVAIAAALRAVGGAGVIAVAGAVVGDLRAVGLAYLGVACSVAFVTGGVYRNRFLALAAQGAGAVVGISVGVALPGAAVSLVAAAAVVGVVSGLVGTIGPNAPGFGMMLSIGLAFGQFGGSSLPWWQQDLWYVVGTAVIALATLSPWVFQRGVLEREAVAAVFFAAADLCASAGTTASRPARRTLAAASASARAAGGHPGAEMVALAAASLYAREERVPASAVAAVRAAGSQVLAAEPITATIDEYTTDDDAHPGLRDLAGALAAASAGFSAGPERRLSSEGLGAATGTALTNGARIGLCLGIATAITVAMHEPAHAFWLPLTVAVIVRPEYASVFVRTVNRVCGTVIGAGVAAAVLWAYPSGLAVAIAAASALGFAVLTAPKLYALSVIGVTASALLSGSIGHVDPVLPGLRLLDTIIGAVVAIAFGYLLWPGARRLPQTARLDAGIVAASAYLDEAVKQSGKRTQWESRRDDAYQRAHQARAACQAAILEPPPVSSVAGKALAAAIELEDLVDAITAVAAGTAAGGDNDAQASIVRQRLSRLERVSMDTSGPRSRKRHR